MVTPFILAHARPGWAPLASLLLYVPRATKPVERHPASPGCTGLLSCLWSAVVSTIGSLFSRLQLPPSTFRGGSRQLDGKSINRVFESSTK
jgi:hypothetical protein